MRILTHRFNLLMLLVLIGQAPCLLAQQPRRIVSLDLCTDWMLIRYADASQQLLFSPLLYDYPVDWVPEGLPRHDGSLEQVLQFQPDLVLTGEFNATQQSRRLRQLGFHVETLPLPLDGASIIGYLHRLLTLIGVEQEWTGMVLPVYPPNGRKLLILGANAIGAGRNTLENDLLIRAGWQNYLTPSGFVSLDLERLVHDPPDAILWSRPDSRSLANLFAEHSALAPLIGDQGALAAQSWRWHCPGPWSLQLIELLAQWKTD